MRDFTATAEFDMKVQGWYGFFALVIGQPYPGLNLFLYETVQDVDWDDFERNLLAELEHEGVTECHIFSAAPQEWVPARGELEYLGTQSGADFSTHHVFHFGL